MLFPACRTKKNSRYLGTSWHIQNQHISHTFSIQIKHDLQSWESYICFFIFPSWLLDLAAVLKLQPLLRIDHNVLDHWQLDSPSRWLIMSHRSFERAGRVYASAATSAAPNKRSSCRRDCWGLDQDPSRNRLPCWTGKHKPRRMCFALVWHLWHFFRSPWW